MSFNPMPLNPHAGESIEALFHRLWNHKMSDTEKARLLADAETLGLDGHPLAARGRVV